MTKEVNPAPKGGQIWRTSSGDLFLLVTKTVDGEVYGDWVWLDVKGSRSSHFKLFNLGAFTHRHPLEHIVDGSTYVCDMTSFGKKLQEKINE